VTLRKASIPSTDEKLLDSQNLQTSIPTYWSCQACPTVLCLRKTHHKMKQTAEQPGNSLLFSHFENKDRRTEKLQAVEIGKEKYCLFFNSFHHNQSENS
jgi:hypothetical protein